MSNDEEIGGGHGYDRTMKTALYVARMIHHDLVYANARTWQWWRAIGGDYKDGLLHQYKDAATGNDTIVDSKLLWALGNYSRFIRPGAVRIDVSAIDSKGKPVADSVTDPYGLMLSAYRNADGSIVLVAINYSDQTKDFALLLPDKKMTLRQSYTTSDREGENLSFRKQNLKSGTTVRIPARAIVTFTE